MLAHASRWLREGAPSRVLPYRVHRLLERWTAEGAYPRAGVLLGVRGPATAEPQAHILFGGDLALHRIGTTAPETLFAGVKDTLSRADLRVVNLETQLIADRPPAGTIGSFLRADPGALGVLRSLRIDAVTCANNHSMDFGPEGLAESVDRLRQAGIRVTGVLGGLETAVVEAGGLRVGLAAFADDWHFHGDHAAVGPVPHGPDRVRGAIDALRRSADVVVVQLHWGYEYSMHPMCGLRDLARSYVDAGADLVVCHHAHVPMGVERWGRGIIAHGLGNFYFGPARRSHPFTSRSFLLRIGLAREGVTNAELVPVRTDTSGCIRSEAADRDNSTLRAIGFLSEAIGDTRYLSAVEDRLLLREGARILVDLSDRLGREDLDGARQRVAFLGPPRQRFLLAWLRNADELSRSIGDLLERLYAGPDVVTTQAMEQEIHGLATQARHRVEAMPQLGRLP